MQNPDKKAPVSVIIPCYLCMETIDRAVSSVAHQTMLPEELVLVEDASPDGGHTLEHLYRLRQMYEGRLDITIVALEKNGGPGVARNAGWDIAQQPYIAFLDADDTWHPKKIKLQYHWIASHPRIMLCGHDIILRTPESEKLTQEIEPTAILIAPWKWLFSCHFSTISVMMSRNLPFRFAVGKYYAEDYLLWLKIALSGYETWKLGATLAYCHKPLYGEGGLSVNMWEMEKGELDTYRRIYRSGMISIAEYIAVVLLSLAKYLRRQVICQLRRYFHG